MSQEHGLSPCSRGNGVQPQGGVVHPDSLPSPPVFLCGRGGKEGGGNRRRFLPLELRIKLYNEVLQLRKEALSHKKIIAYIQKKHGVRLSGSTVSYWLRRIRSPYNKGYIPSIDLLKPSQELAYVIGVMLGDGYATKHRRPVKGYNNVEIGLAVKDREFAEEFGECLSKVLGRQPKEPIYKNSINRYVVKVRSKTLYELLRKPVNLDRLRKYIEHCEGCMAAFLRGFFDSEGCVDESGYIRTYNTDLQLMIYVRDLLKRLGIESTGPKIKHRKGRILHDRRKGKIYTVNKDCYMLYIRASGYRKFYETIGCTIERKRRRLEEYLRRRRSQTPSPPFTPLYIYIIPHH